MVARVPAVKQRGGARPGSGRPKGIPNKARIYPSLRGEVITMRNRYEVMPLDHMLKIINTTVVKTRNETDEDFAKRKEAHQIRQDAAARAAAPFMHYRLASIEHTGKDGEPIRHQVDLSRLSDEELQILEKLTAKAEMGSTVDLDRKDYQVIDDDEDVIDVE